jgi:hypothetical protein
MAGSRIEIPPEPVANLIVEACGQNNDRWLYGAYVHGDNGYIGLVGGPSQTPYYTDSYVDRCVDLLSHETMHEIITDVCNRDVSWQYDDLLRNIGEQTMYLHQYARGEI